MSFHSLKIPVLTQSQSCLSPFTWKIKLKMINNQSLTTKLEGRLSISYRGKIMLPKNWLACGLTWSERSNKTWLKKNDDEITTNNLIWFARVFTSLLRKCQLSITLLCLQWIIQSNHLDICIWNHHYHHHRPRLTI